MDQYILHVLSNRTVVRQEMDRPGLTTVLLDKTWRMYWSMGPWRIHWNSSEFYLLTRYVVYSILPSNSNSVYESLLVMQSCPALCDPMDCSLTGFSVHGILQARILQWVAISFSRGSSQPRDRIWVSCIAGRFFTIWATEKPLVFYKKALLILLMEVNQKNNSND